MEQLDGDSAIDLFNLALLLLGGVGTFFLTGSLFGGAGTFFLADASGFVELGLSI